MIFFEVGDMKAGWLGVFDQIQTDVKARDLMRIDIHNYNNHSRINHPGDRSSFMKQL